MPVTFTCDTSRSGHIVQQIVFSLMRTYPNYAYFKLEPEVARELFNGDVREGDVWALQAKLVSRVGANGMNRG